MKGLVAAVFCAAITAAPALDAQDGGVYRWVDEHGVVHYSDQPREGAEKVKLAEPQSYSSAEAAVSSSARPIPPESVDGAAGDYAVRIQEPEHDSVAWNTGGEVRVTSAVEPGLDIAAGHRIIVLVDGKRVGAPSAGLSVVVNDLHRGTYQIAVNVVDSAGNLLAESAAVTLHVRQTSIQNPQRRR